MGPEADSKQTSQISELEDKRKAYDTMMRAKGVQMPRRECVTVFFKEVKGEPQPSALLVRGDLKRFIDPALRVLVLIDTRTKDEHMIPLKRIKYMKVEEITVI